jgi:hypothetical protein
METKIEFRPFILALLFILGIFGFFWLLSQPLEIIYDPNAPPYPYSLGGQEYH